MYLCLSLCIQDHPINCLPGMPILQYSIVNLTSAVTGRQLDLDPLHLVCGNNGAITPGCVGYSRGFTMPDNDVWSLAGPSNLLKRLSACAIQKSFVATAHYSAHPCHWARIKAAVWRGSYSGILNGWPRATNALMSKKLSRAGDHWLLPTLMYNKRLRMTMMSDLYPWLDFKAVPGPIPLFGREPYFVPWIDHRKVFVCHTRCKASSSSLLHQVHKSNRYQ
jgi:hypothetical protein